MPSQTSTADIYVACLYSQGDGMPLWNPSPIRTGAIGYIRDGSFFTLYNIEDGPPDAVHPAADPILAGRRRSTPATQHHQQNIAAAAAAAGAVNVPALPGQGALSPPYVSAESHSRTDSIGSAGAGTVTPPSRSGASVPTSHRASDPSVPAIPGAYAGTLPPRSSSISARGPAGGSGAADTRRSSVMGIVGGVPSSSSLRAPPPPPSSSLSDPISSTTATNTHSHAAPAALAAGGNGRVPGSMTPPYAGGAGAAVMTSAFTGGGGGGGGGGERGSGWSSPRDRDEPRSPRLRDRDLPPDPPLPLQTEYEDLRRFDSGPRSSSTYTCLGFSAGAQIPGAPAGGMWSFKSSGGDGALLIPRDPTEREQLRHVGNLKIYVKTNLRWIAYRYGISEDIEQDDIVLIFSQDRTSDWACAVSRNTSRGAQVDFEVFSIGKASVWGEWRTAMTASQRGPHRGGQPAFNPNFAMGSAAAGQMQAAAVGAASSGAGATAAPGASAGGSQDNKAGGLNFSFGAVSASLSPSFDAGVHMDTREDGERSGSQDSGTGADLGVGLNVRLTASGSGGEVGNSGGKGNGATTPQQQLLQSAPPMQGWPLANPYPADQAIIVKRITMKHRLPFLPASIRASAEPRPDRARDRDDEEGARTVRAHDASPQSQSGSGGREAGPSASPQRRPSGARPTPPFDPLNLLHEYILTRAPLARASIASDAECACLLRAALRAEPELLAVPDEAEQEHEREFGHGHGHAAGHHAGPTGAGGSPGARTALLSPRWIGRVRRALFRVADACAQLEVDPADGVATVHVNIARVDAGHSGFLLGAGMGAGAGVSASHVPMRSPPIGALPEGRTAVRMQSGVGTVRPAGAGRRAAAAMARSHSGSASGSGSSHSRRVPSGKATPVSS